MAIEPINTNPIGNEYAIPVRPITTIDSTSTRLLSCLFNDDELALLDVPASLNNSVLFVGVAPEGTLPEQNLWSVVKQWYDNNGKLKRQAFRTNVAWTERSYDWPGDGTRAFGTIQYIDPTIPVGFNIFENDCYPEDYGWSQELSANQLLLQLSNWINGNFSGQGIATVVDNILTIKAVAVGVAGNSYITYSSNPEGAISSGQFTGGTEPWA